MKNFFPEMTNEMFSDMLRDISSLLCHTNPAGDSCLKYEADLLTGTSVSLSITSFYITLVMLIIISPQIVTLIFTESDLNTVFVGRIQLKETIEERCLVKDENTNASIVPAFCLPQCKLFLQRKKGRSKFRLGAILAHHFNFVQLYTGNIYRPAKKLERHGKYQSFQHALSFRGVRVLSNLLEETL